MIANRWYCEVYVIKLSAREFYVYAQWFAGVGMVGLGAEMVWTRGAGLLAMGVVLIVDLWSPWEHLK